VIAADDVFWARGDRGATGVLVLAGSSGRLDVARAQVLASAGATALALRWFGGVGQPAVPREVALETFTAALDLLALECDRLAILGTSYGAEAALLTAVRDPRVAAAVTIAPTDVVWEGASANETDPPRSKWTWQGESVPFIPVDRTWTPVGDVPAFVRHYEHSRALTDAASVEKARIPVERFAGELVLVCGGDDQVWPSAASARAITLCRAAAGLETVVVEDPYAGHPVVLPGEPGSDLDRLYRVGGDARAAERLGEHAWPAIRSSLRLGRS
jgi:uncharacterized protein